MTSQIFHSYNQLAGEVGRHIVVFKTRTFHLHCLHVRLHSCYVKLERHHPICMSFGVVQENNIICGDLLLGTITLVGR